MGSNPDEVGLQAGFKAKWPTSFIGFKIKTKNKSA